MTVNDRIALLVVKPRKLPVVGVLMTSTMLPEVSVTEMLILVDGVKEPLIFELKKNPPIADGDDVKLEKVIGLLAVLVDMKMLPAKPGNKPLPALT